MENTSLLDKKNSKKVKKCSQENDQEPAWLQALGNLERKLDLLQDMLIHLVDSVQEDTEECLDDEESLSTST